MNTKTFLKTANKILYDRYIGIVMECVEMNSGMYCTANIEFPHKMLSSAALYILAIL